MSKMSGLHRKEQARLFCQGHAGKVRFYKKVLDEWIEPGDGTFVVRIKPGYSFDKNLEVREMSFDSVDRAIDAIRGVYAGRFIKKPDNKLLTDSERAKMLVEEFGN